MVGLVRCSAIEVSGFVSEWILEIEIQASIEEK